MVANTKKTSNKLLKRFGVNAGRKLFVPKKFDFSTTTEILEFIEDQSFASFISNDKGTTRVTAAAIIYNRVISNDSRFSHEFIGHIAKRNPQVEAIKAGLDAVALVQGPDAYISPRWNVENPGLPTWSYLSVQLRGVFDIVTKTDETREVLSKTIAHLERDAEKPWTLIDASPKLVEQMMQHIVAFRFKVEDMQGVKRLNQNKSLADRRGIIEGLSTRGDSGAKKIAALMLMDFARPLNNDSQS